jgi:hypothetical protein
MNSSFNSIQQKAAIRCRLGIAVASILLLGQAQVASAGTVSVWVNVGIGWQEIASDPTGLLAFAGSYTTTNGVFNLQQVSAATFGPNAKLDSSASSIEHIGGGADELQIAVIGTGFTAPTIAPIGVKSQVSGDNAQGVLSSLTFQSYVDPTNNGFPFSLAGGQGLQMPTLFPTIGGAGANQNTTIASNLNSPFSVAELFTLTMTGSGFISNLGGDTTLNSVPATLNSVPEPSSITLLCISLVALGGYARNRRQRQLRRP